MDVASFLGRCAGFGALLVTLAKAVAHVVILDHLPLVQSLLWGAMAATCIVCGGHLTARLSVRAWLTLALMSAGMLAVHLQGSVSPGAGHHAHGRTGAGFPSGELGLPMRASLMLTCAEMLLGVIGVWVMTSAGRRETTLPLSSAP